MGSHQNCFLTFGKKTKKTFIRNVAYIPPCVYRVSHVLVDLGWVDFDLSVLPILPSLFCQIPISPSRVGQTVEHSKSKSTKPSLRAHGTPCSLFMVSRTIGVVLATWEVETRKSGCWILLVSQKTFCDINRMLLSSVCVAITEFLGKLPLCV